MFQSTRDRLLVIALRSLAAVSSLILVLIVGFLLVESFPALSQVGITRFATDSSWHPSSDDSTGTFQLLWIVTGTLLTSLVAVALATPLGICSAAYVQFYAPRRIGCWYRRIVELMAGVPSVVFGLWGLVVLVPLVARIAAPGQSLFSGSIVLTLMILPTIALLSDAAFLSVPRDYLRAAAALGLSRTTIVFRVMVPAARSGLCSAVILGLVRALGETMAVVMVCGNVVRMPRSVFDPVRTLTATIALEMGYARGDHRSALFVCGTVLLILVAGFIGIAEAVDRRHLRGAA